MYVFLIGLALMSYYGYLLTKIPKESDIPNEACKSLLKHLLTNYLSYLEKNLKAQGNKSAADQAKLTNLIKEWKVLQSQLGTRAPSSRTFTTLENYILDQAIKVLEMTQNKEDFVIFFNQSAPIFWKDKVNKNYAPSSLARTLSDSGLLTYAK